MPGVSKEKITNIAGKVTLVYVVLSIFWVAGTDRLVATYVKNQELNLALQTYKGWLFVAITGALIFFLLKREETRIKELENRSKILLQAIPDIMFRFNIDGVFVDYSAEDEKNLAVSPEQFLGKNIVEVLPSDIAMQMMEATNKARQTGKMQTFEYSIQTPKGLMYSEARVVAKNGDVVAFVRDVTDKNRYIEALKNSEDKFSQVFENNPQLMAIFTVDRGAVWDVNKAFLEGLGYKKEEILGRLIKEIGLWGDSSAEAGLFEELKKNDVIKNRAINIRRTDGVMVSVLCSMRMVNINGVGCVLFSAVEGSVV